jgi:hypothetical protein
MMDELEHLPRWPLMRMQPESLPHNGRASDAAGGSGGYATHTLSSETEQDTESGSADVAMRHFTPAKLPYVATETTNPKCSLTNERDFV